MSCSGNSVWKKKRQEYIVSIDTATSCWLDSVSPLTHSFPCRYCRNTSVCTDQNKQTKKNVAAGCFITLLWKEHEVNEYVMESRAVSSRCGGGGKYAGYFKSQTHMSKHVQTHKWRRQIIFKSLRCKILKVSFNNNKEQILSIFLSLINKESFFVSFYILKVKNES